MKKTVSAVWQDGLKDGESTLSIESGALKGNSYGFNTYFEGTPGINPEEPASAAHTGCFSTALSMMLGEVDLTAGRIGTRAKVILDKQSNGFTITAVHLVFRVRMPGAGAQTFEQITNKVKAGYPVPRVLNAKVSLDTSLDG